MTWALTLGGYEIGGATVWQFAADAPPDLFGFDKLRTDDSDIPARWGSVTNGPDLPGGRTLRVKVFTNAASENDALAALYALVAAWTITDVDEELTLTAPGQTFTVFGRLRRQAVDLTDSVNGVVVVALELYCPDPRYYGPTLLAGSGIQAAQGGLSFPTGFPLGFGSILPGQATLTNAGNATTPLAALAVPGSESIVSPSFRCLETGETLTFPGLTIPPGTMLEIDWAARTAVTAQSAAPGAKTVDVSNYIDRTNSDWWTRASDLAPGVSNIVFAGATGSGGVVYFYRSAWMI